MGAFNPLYLYWVWFGPRLHSSSLVATHGLALEFVALGPATAATRGLGCQGLNGGLLVEAEHRLVAGGSR